MIDRRGTSAKLLITAGCLIRDPYIDNLTEKYFIKEIIIMEEKELELNEQDTYQNDDVEALKAMQARYDAELAKRDQKYSALLKYATEGGKVSSETPHEPTPAERKQHIEQIAKEVRDNKISSLEQAKRLIEYDDYVVENGGRTIFTFTDGTPSPVDLESADRVKNLLQYAIDSSDGSPEVFQATLASKLKDIR